MNTNDSVELTDPEKKDEIKVINLVQLIQEATACHPSSKVKARRMNEWGRK